MSHDKSFIFQALLCFMYEPTKMGDTCGVGMRQGGGNPWD